MSAPPLIIVESHRQAARLERALEGAMTVRATGGHLEVARGSRGGRRWRAGRRAVAILAALQAEVDRAPRVFLATDPDREGLAIAGHLSVLLDTPPDRLWWAPVPDLNPERVFWALGRAVPILPGGWPGHAAALSLAVRGALDRVVARRLRADLNRAGIEGGCTRVQVAALGLARSLEQPLAGRPDAWSLTPKSHGPGGLAAQTPGLSSGLYLMNLGVAEGLTRSHWAWLKHLADVRRLWTLEGSPEPHRVEGLEAGPMITWPAPPPPDTHDIDRALSASLRQTRRALQHLYEGRGGLSRSGSRISYPRTRSRRWPIEAVAAIKQHLAEISDHPTRLPDAAIFDPERDSDWPAHTALRPITPALTPELAAPHLRPFAAQVYQEVHRRSVAACLPSARGRIWRVEARSEATGARVEPAWWIELLEPGWLRAFGHEPEAPPPLPAIGAILPGMRLTQARPTEGLLASALAAAGVGGLTSGAEAINGLRRRGWLLSQAGVISWSAEGRQAYEVWAERWPAALGATLTSSLEEVLTSVAAGRLTEEKGIARGKRLIEASRPAGWSLASGTPSPTAPGPSELDRSARSVPPAPTPCPRCHTGRIERRRSRAGRVFFGCDRWPECDFTHSSLPLPGPCPQCAHPWLAAPPPPPERSGRFLVRRSTFRGASPPDEVHCPACRWTRGAEKGQHAPPET